jgi:predicted dehydrogenase
MTQHWNPALPFREELLARDPRSGVTGTSRWGVVGTGGVAHLFCEDLALLPGARLVAVAGRDPERARRFASGHRFERVHSSYRELVVDDAVDIVYVATPHGSHAEIVAAALRAGKHVVCEKPFTINSRQARPLFDLARAHGRFLMEAAWSRYLPATQLVLQALLRGDIGEPRWIQADLGFACPPELSRFWDPAEGGGALIEIGIYTLGWPLLVFGEPTRVHATSELTATGVDRRTTVQLQYPTGSAQAVCSLDADGPGSLIIAGTAGRIQIPTDQNNPATVLVTSGGKTRSLNPPRIGNGYLYEICDAVRLIEEGALQSGIMPWSATLQLLQLFDAIREQVGIRYPADEA